MIRSKIGNTLFCISLAVMLFLFAAVLVLSVGYVKELGLSTAFVLLEALFLLSVYFILYKMIQRMEEKAMKAVCPALMILIFAGQVLFIMLIKSYFRADALQIYREAAAMIQDGVIRDNPYFGIYPNNIPVTLVTYWLLRLAQIFRIPAQDWMRYLQIWNAAGISIGIFFGYKLLLRVSGYRKSALFLAGCLLNPLVYFLSPWYYTATMSIPFLMAGLYYFYCFLQQKRYRELILAAAIFYAGIKIRATVGIGVIAVLIYCVLYLLRGGSIPVKKAGASILAAVFTVLVLQLGYAGLENHYVKMDYTDTAYPAVHWIMMASHGTGGYNAEDCAYIESFPTREEKEKAAWERLQDYLEESSSGEKLDLALHKMAVTWADGTGSYNASLQNSESYSSVYEYVSGNNRDILLNIVQASRILNLVFICAGAAALLWRRNFVYVLYLTLAGGILFHIMWEASSQYSAGFLILILVLQTEGMELVWEKLQNHVELRNEQGENQNKNLEYVGIKYARAGMLLPIASILMQGIVLLAERGSGDFRVEKYYHYVLHQEMWEDEQAINLRAGEELCQTFTADKNFSKIGIKCYNLDDNNRGAQYEIRIGRDGEELYRGILSGEFLYGKDYYRISLDMQPPGTYDISIENVWSDGANQIYFCNYGSEDVNLYKGGTLMRDGQDIQASLTFMVYDTEDVIIRQEKDARLLVLNAILAGGVLLAYGVTAMACRGKIRQADKGRTGK